MLTRIFSISETAESMSDIGDMAEPMRMAHRDGGANNARAGQLIRRLAAYAARGGSRRNRVC